LAFVLSWGCFLTVVASARPSAAADGSRAGVAVRMSDIRRDHPRLLMTAEDLPALRKRLAPALGGSQPRRYLAAKTWMDKQWDMPYEPARQGERLSTHAILYALGKIDGVAYEGQTRGVQNHSIEQIGRKGVELLKLSADYWDKHSAEAGYGTFALMPVCWAYDCLYPLLSEADRKDLIGKLISAAYLQKRHAQTTTFKDYSLRAHNYVVVGLTLAGENLAIDHQAGWDPKVRYTGNSDQFAGRLIDDLNRLYLDRFYAGWKFATQGGGHFQGVNGHFGDVAMLVEVLWPLEKAAGKDVLGDLEYLTAVPQWWSYAQLPEYEAPDARTGRTRTMKGWMFATDDENFPVGFGWAQEAAIVTARFGKDDSGALASWFIQYYVPENRRMRNVHDMIWFDQTVPPKSPVQLKLPLTRYFGRLNGQLPPGTPEGVRHPVGAGIVVMRSSWTDPNGTLAVFKSRSWQFTHDHPDSGSFIIIKKGYLAIDSGRYQNGDWKPEEMNYDYRTVAHNTMLVFDPKERFDPKGVYANDGGQRVRDAYRNWPEDYAVGNRKDVGGLVRIESLPGKYDYMLGDHTRAYQSTQFTNYGNRPKVSLAQRAFVYLRSGDGERDFFVVLDRVTATDPAFEKRWLLHTIEQPRIDGAYSAGGVDGKGGMNPAGGTPGSISTDSSLVTVDENKGRLFCRTLLPRPHKTVIRGGPNARGQHAVADSFEYLDGTGRQWPLNQKFMSTTYIRECGNYRAEIIPQEARKDDVFLHVLHPAGQPQMPPTELVESSDGQVIGVCVDGWCVLFARSGRIEKASVALPGPLRRVLITDLAPEAEFDVRIEARSVTISPRGPHRSSNQGTISVEAP
jgi:hypothetical protein